MKVEYGGHTIQQRSENKYKNMKVESSGLNPGYILCDIYIHKIHREKIYFQQ